jgi:hypothetical protein
MIRDECDKVAGQYKHSPRKGLIKFLEYVKIDYEICSNKEIKISFGGSKYLIVKEE